MSESEIIAFKQHFKTDLKLLFRNHYLIKEQFENATNKVYKSEEGNKI